MCQEINLYLGDMQVEFSQPPQILYNYIQDELVNPTIIKNSFSKTITIEGTNGNNKIFGHYWNLERIQEYGSYTGVYFNASRKTPFTLYVDGDIYESGYVKLLEVRKNNNGIEYDIELFGGLGQFFYSLTYNQDTGNKLTLGDLNYRNWGDSDAEFDFTVDKNTLKQAWFDHSPNVGESSIWHYINFAPAYNGYPTQNFSPDKVLINTSGAPNEIITKADKDKKIIEDLTTSGTYITYGDGYVNASLPKKMTEWELGDLRSGWQRPIIRMKEIINASINYMKKPENGSWNVELDSEFFNENNPYWEKTWMTLPLLSEINYVNETDADISPTISISRTTNQDGYSLFAVSGMTQRVNKVTFAGHYGINSYSSISGYNKLYVSQEIMYRVREHTYNPMAIYDGAIIIRAEALNQLGTVVATSPWNYLTSKRAGEYNWDLLDGFVWDYVTRSSIIQCPGYFQKSGNVFYWVDESGNTQDLVFELDLQGRAYSQIRLVVQWLGNKNLRWNNTGVLYAETEIIRRRQDSNEDVRVGDTGSYNEYMDLAFISAKDAGDKSMSGKEFGKKDLLNTSYSPADYFISYCKLFNLHFRKDVFENKLYIETRKNFYEANKIVDLNDLIDRGKKVKISPVAFDKQWYDFKLPMVQGEFAEDYKKTTSFDYGTKRINTGYEFDAETKNLLEGNCLKSAVQSLEKSKYYSYCGTGIDDDTDAGFQPWMLEGLKYNLYKYNDVDDTCEIELPIRYSSLQGISTYDKYYDLFDKPQFHSEDNKTIDGSNVLLFFTGFEKCISPNNIELNYWITDDLPAMEALNSNSCWLYTNNEFNEAGDRIAYKIDRIPRFSRYWLSGDVISHSLDFGQPRQLYAPNLSTIEESTIYYNYWKTYIEDIYDVNTRVLDCYVKLDSKPNPNWLRSFYWFDNSIWRINKIEDWSISSFETTKMQFIKVQDINNYSNKVVSDEGIITISANPLTVPSTGGTVTFTVTVADGSCWVGDESWDYYFNETPTGCGNQTFSMNVSEAPFGRKIKLNVINENNVAANGVIIEQQSIMFDVQQFAAWVYNNVPSTGGICLYTVKSSTPWTVTCDREYCTLSITGGTGNTEYGQVLQVTWAENEYANERSARLTFTDANGNKIYKNKTQDGRTALNLDYPASSTTKPVVWEESGATVVVKPDWITIEDKGDGDYDFTADDNDGDERSGTVILENKDGEQITIYCYQEANDKFGFSIEPTTLEFANTGSSVILEILNSNNDSWEIVAKSNWVTLSQSAGTSGANITVVAEPNPEDKERIGVILVWDRTTNKTYTAALKQAAGEPLPPFRVEPDALFYNHTGGSQFLQVINEGGDYWRMVGYPEWITASISQGSSSAILSVTAQPNTGDDTRTGTIVIYNATQRTTHTVICSQTSESTESGRTITIVPNPAPAAASGETITVQIAYTNRNGDFLIAVPESGITVGDIVFTGDVATVEITVPENGTFTGKTYSVVFNGDGISATLTINQEAATPYLRVVPNTLTFGATGGTATFTIITNDSWTIQ